jgi:hypothetical protein
MPTTSISQVTQACIRDCQDCHRACLETVQYCLQAGGRHVEAGHVRLMLDCAEACETAANFMLRSSTFHGRTCGVCAEVCERCAADCDSFGDDQAMKACAETCRRCATSCRQMAAPMAA